MPSLRLSLVTVASVCALLSACAGGSSGTGTAGTSGGGTAGTTGAGGTGGATAGTTGSAGTTGAAGTTGNAGTGGSVSGVAGSGVAGTGGAGTAGTTGNAGTGGGTAGASGGRGGTGGGAGTGGTAGSNAGRGGNGGPGGSAGAGGRGGTGGSAGATGGTGGAATGSCTGLPLCDTFESSTVGGPPSSALWTIVNDGATAPVIDSMGAHGSSRSVKFVGSQPRVYIRNSTVIGTLGPVVHARYYVRFGNALPTTHTAFMVTHPTSDFSESNELRLGAQMGQTIALHWNVADDSANLPIIYNGDPFSFTPTMNTWYCIEATINTSNGHLNVAVDGVDIAGLTADGVATANIDSDWVTKGTQVTRFYSALADFNLGWRNFGGANQVTVWFDDVALSSTAIGCN